jgi:hypothetical protein
VGELSCHGESLECAEQRAPSSWETSCGNEARVFGSLDGKHYIKLVLQRPTCCDYFEVASMLRLARYESDGSLLTPQATTLNYLKNILNWPSGLLQFIDLDNYRSTPT